MIKNKALCYKCSAGTGKTYALSVRYISLLMLDVKASSILTLTFTNKAAIQMRQRIVTTCENLENDKTFLEEIQKQTNLSKQEIVNKKNKIVKQFKSSEVSIYTIDKFINMILKNFGEYGNINYDFTIKKVNIEKIGYEFLLSLDETNFDALLNVCQLSEKKYLSMLDIFMNIMEKKEDIKTVNIEKKLLHLCVEEVIKNINKIKIYVDTQEKTQNRTKKLFFNKTFQDFINSSWITKASLIEHSYFKNISTPYLEELFIQLKKSIQIYFKINSQYVLGQIYTIFLKFEEFKRSYSKKLNYLDFSDISNAVYDLLTKKIDKDFLYFRLDSKYNHILIDEFQDTSVLQYKILKPLIDETFIDTEDCFKSFFYVGDPKQSIYRFRGGKADLFDELIKNYPSMEVKNLTKNYRSKGVIVNFVNEHFLKIKNYAMNLQSWEDDGGYVKIQEVSDKNFSKDNFEAVLYEVKLLLKNGIDQNNIAILTYTNDDILKLSDYLQEEIDGINITTATTSMLIKIPKVKAIINFLKYLYFKEDIYIENFNSILGYEYGIKHDIKVDIKKENLIKITHRICDFFELFDENSIKFLEEVLQYKNIVDFVYNIDDMDVSMVNKELKGIQILTVFKAKGLEFDTVIVLDRVTKKVNDTSKLLFEYDGVDLKQVHYKMKNKDFFDEDYKRALEDEQKLKNFDELNIMYVGLTRAINNLIIIKKEKNSAFEVLGLCGMEQGILVKERYTNYEKDIIYKKYEIMNILPQNQKAMLENEKSNLHAKYLGIATHYCLEMMNDFTQKSLETSLQRTKSIYSNVLDENDFKKINLMCKNLINNQNFLNIVKNSKILKEQALSFNKELKILDLLCVFDAYVVVIDYKTSNIKDDRNIAQVRHYKKALDDIFKTKKVFGYLIYLNELKVDILEV